MEINKQVVHRLLVNFQEIIEVVEKSDHVLYIEKHASYELSLNIALQSNFERINENNQASIIFDPEGFLNARTLFSEEQLVDIVLREAYAFGATP